MSAPPAFVDVARALLPPSSCGGLIIVLSAYFDDSGTNGDSEIVVMAGFIGTAEQWKPFDEAWAAKLTEPLLGKPTLSRFHMANCMARNGALFGYSEADRNAVIHD